MVEQGIASAEDVETALKAGAGLRFPLYGPLEHLDAIGLGPGHHSARLRAAQPLHATAPAKYLTDLVAGGNLGCANRTKTSQLEGAQRRRAAPDAGSVPGAAHGGRPRKSAYDEVVRKPRAGAGDRLAGTRRPAGGMPAPGFQGGRYPHRRPHNQVGSLTHGRIHYVATNNMPPQDRFLDLEGPLEVVNFSGIIAGYGPARPHQPHGIPRESSMAGTSRKAARILTLSEMSLLQRPRPQARPATAGWQQAFPLLDWEERQIEAGPIVRATGGHRDRFFMR